MRTGQRHLKRGCGPTGLGLSSPGGEKDLHKIPVSAREIQHGITSPKQCQSFSKQEEVKCKLFIAYLFMSGPLLFFHFWDNLLYCLLLFFLNQWSFCVLFFFLFFFFQDADASSVSKHRTSREKICNLVSWRTLRHDAGEMSTLCPKLQVHPEQPVLPKLQHI